MSSPVQKSLISPESNLNVLNPVVPAEAVQIPTVPTEAPSLQGRVDEKKFREQAEKFKAIESGELQSFLDWMSGQSDIDNNAISSNLISIKDITLADKPGPAPENEAAEEGYVDVPVDDLLAEQFVISHQLDAQQSQGMIAKLKNTFWRALGYR